MAGEAVPKLTVVRLDERAIGEYLAVLRAAPEPRVREIADMLDGHLRAVGADPLQRLIDLAMDPQHRDMADALREHAVAQAATAEVSRQRLDEEKALRHAYEARTAFYSEHIGTPMARAVFYVILAVAAAILTLLGFSPSEWAVHDLPAGVHDLPPP